jgi:hypothetical protein
LAKRCALPYFQFPIPRPRDQNFHPEIIRNASRMHNYALARAYRSIFTQDTIHIRSNIGEIARAFYMKGAVSATENAARTLSPLWSRAKDIEGSEPIFAEWANRTGFWTAPSIHYSDLLYWEHRMPRWHSPMVLESDISLDTVSLFNERKLMERLLSVPLEQRQENAAVLEALRRHPETMREPINRPPTTRRRSSPNVPTGRGDGAADAALSSPDMRPAQAEGASPAVLSSSDMRPALAEGAAPAVLQLIRSTWRLCRIGPWDKLSSRGTSVGKPRSLHHTTDRR